MPIYEYECLTCGITFEAMQPVSAKALKVCQGLGCKGQNEKGKVQRLVSASGFILKGSGWYATDYPSDSRKKGWANEANGANSNAGSSSSTPAGDTGAATPAPASGSDEAPKPAATRKASSASKNPYTGGKTKKARVSK